MTRSSLAVAEKVAVRGTVMPTNAEFERVRKLLKLHTGISLSAHKQSMVASRLGKRLVATGCSSFAEYLAIVDEGRDADAELVQMINALTTNKTAFYREPHHFETLGKHIRELVDSGRRRIRIWSAACSNGAEPYTIAMTVMEALGGMQGVDVRVLASDIDTAILGRAEAGVYSREELEGLPPAALKRWFTRRSGDRFEIAMDLKRMVKFRQINLMSRPWPIHTLFDAIFCRNVMIYFEEADQRGIYEAQARLLEPHGLYFAGHSENLHWLGGLFRNVGKTVHARGPLAGGAASAAQARALARATPLLPSPRARAVANDVAPATSSIPTSTAPRHRIHAGDVFASAAPAMVETVLGSCVAACLWDPVARIGGMNHFLLPEPGKELAEETIRARYGIHAMELLINEMARLGADRRRLRGKLFGAAHVVTGLSRIVPDRNAEFARSFFQIEGIELTAERLGGHEPLEVRFDTFEGRAFVRVVELPPSEIAERERRHEEELRRKILQGGADVTLF